MVHANACLKMAGDPPAAQVSKDASAREKSREAPFPKTIGVKRPVGVALPPLSQGGYKA